MDDDPEAAFSAHGTKGKNNNFRQRQGGRKEIICYRCQKSGHIARNCKDSAQEDDKPSTAFHATFMAKANSEPKVTAQWWIDSGCTTHMTNDSSVLSNMRTPETDSVLIGDGTRMNVQGMGDYTEGRISLRNVLHVPELKANLISVSSALDNGVDSFVFSKEGVSIIKNKKTIASGSREGLLFKLNVDDEDKGRQGDMKRMSTKDKPPNASYRIWHLRLGHLHYDAIRKLQNQGQLVATGKIPTEPCSSCIMGKHVRSAFNQGPITRSQRVGEVVHSDVCGPMDTQGSAGARYFVTFIDDKSRFISIYPIVRKSDVVSRFKEFVEKLERELGMRTVRQVISDNGGEYTGEAFRRFCKDKGIHQVTTIPHTPQQNGVSERANRTIMEGARAMIQQNNMPRSCWPEAVVYAAYVRNRSPSRILDYRSAFELRFDEKPNLKKIRIFGSDIYYHVPKALRRKLDAKARKGRFIGIASGQYGYLIRTSTGKTIASRDVVFVERELEKDQSDDDIPEDIPTVRFRFKASKEHQEEARDEELQQNQNETSMSETSEEDSQEYDDFHTMEEYRDDKNNLQNDEENEQTEEAALSKRPRGKPKRYTPEDFRFKTHRHPATALIASVIGITPETRQQAMNLPDSDQWVTAMDAEFSSHMKNSTWKLVKKPEGANVVGSKWAFKIKTDQDGIAKGFKARLCAKGFSQVPGVDYEETFAPVVSATAFRMVFAIAAARGIAVHHMDVTTAFLNAKLSEDIYMRQPEGYEILDSDGSELVCKLEKAIYGLKQAGRAWWKTVSGFLSKLGFKECFADQCLFIRRTQNDFAILALYVDDIVIAATMENDLVAIKRFLNQEYIMKDMGLLTHALGVKVEQNLKNGTITLSLGAYIDTILVRFGMQNCKPATTPMITKDINKKAAPMTTGAFPYRECVGALMYAACTARPDISTAVGRCARSTESPTSNDVIDAKRVLRYLKGTRTLGLIFQKAAHQEAAHRNTDNQLVLSAFVDADWGNSKDRKSTSGYLIKYGGAVLWGSRRQKCVSLSSTESEYIAAATAVQQIKWCRALLRDLGFPQKSPTIVLEDNQACIKMIENEALTQRSKHIDIKYHYIRDEQRKGEVKFEYVPSEDNLADLFTKPLSAIRFNTLRDRFMTAACTAEEGVGTGGAARLEHASVELEGAVTGRSFPYSCTS